MDYWENNWPLYRKYFKNPLNQLYTEVQLLQSNITIVTYNDLSNFCSQEHSETQQNMCEKKYENVVHFVPSAYLLHVEATGIQPCILVWCGQTFLNRSIVACSSYICAPIFAMGIQLSIQVSPSNNGMSAQHSKSSINKHLSEAVLQLAI